MKARVHNRRLIQVLLFAGVFDNTDVFFKIGQAVLGGIG